MIRTVSLLPLCAAFLSAFLIAVTLDTNQRRSRMVVFFVLLNLSTMLWSLTYAIELNTPAAVTIDVAQLGSHYYYLFVLEMLGLSAAPTYWFLFTAAYARKTSWITGWRLWLAHVPVVYSMALATTNASFQLFVRQDNPGGPTSYGPLAIPHQALSFVLICWGIWLLVSTSMRSLGRGSKSRAIALGAASLMPVLGALVWALRHVLSLPLTVNPTPVLFPVLNVVLAQTVLHRGLGDIAPIAASQTLSTMTDSVMTIDDGGSIISMNPAAERVLPSASTGDCLGDVSQEMAERVEECLRQERGYVEFEFQTDDAVYWGRVRRTLDRRGRAIGCIILLSDVTELRQTRSELQDLNAELQNRVNELADTNAHLSEATKAKSRFLANMSHELRTPLNSIIGFTDIVLLGMVGDLNDEQRKQLGMVNSSGRHLLMLINNVLDISKVEAGRESLNLAPARLSEILRAVTEKTRPAAEQKGLSLTLNAPPRDLPLVTDSTRLQQILLNLVGNGIKFTDEGSVTLDVTDSDDSVVFRVTDTGSGIPADKLEKIFDEFEQIEPPDGAKAPGTGLGLTISRNLAEVLGGSVTVESSAGVGSVFTLVMPKGLAGIPEVAGSA